MRAQRLSPYRFILVTPLACLSTFLVLPSSSSACGYISPDDSRQLSIHIAPGVDRVIEAYLFKVEGGDDSCTASMQVELSAFPSSRLATRPAEIAATLRELADEWGVERCTVYVTYENDTKDGLASHELCILEEFRFDRGDFWSTSTEGFCWEPHDRTS